MFRSPHVPGLRPVAPLLFAAAMQLTVLQAGAQNRYVETDLVSDIPGLATFTDPDLVNPWGIAFGATSPFWVSNNGTETSTLYNSTGVKQGLVVAIPTPSGGAAAPTGVVFNGTGALPIATGGPSSVFLFATEDGTIAGWHPSLGTSASTLVDNGGAGAIYKGLALSGSGPTAQLYAANFRSGTVDVFDANLAPILSGAFVDPTLPSGYAPFNVQNIADRIYVSYALQDADAEDDVPGAGHGFINVFDTNGMLLNRFISGGRLDSPWGMTLAPATFGPFGGSLLVGNFGDGAIDAYDPATGVFLGALRRQDSSPLQIPGLWGLTFGNGGNGGDPNLLYFAAGIPGPGGALEDHGLFGSIAPVTTPEPASLVLLATGMMGILFTRRRVRRA